MHPMIRRSRGALGAYLLLVGCSGADTESTLPGEALAASPPPSLGEQPTLEEFVESVHQEIRVGDSLVQAYVLEGDMLVPYEMVVAYYEQFYVPVREKSVGFQVFPDGPAGPFAPPLQVRTSLPIRYCIDSTFAAAERAGVASAVATAAAAWTAAAARLTWQYVSNLDGASCTPAQTGKDIQITKFPRNAQGAFPGEPNQILGITSPPPEAGVMLHELGHIIGLAHEEFHSQAGLGCQGGVPNVRGARSRDISAAWDPQSVMQFRDANGLAACTNVNSVGQLPSFLSANDKVAARTLYP